MYAKNELISFSYFKMLPFKISCLIQCGSCHFFAVICGNYFKINIFLAYEVQKTFVHLNVTDILILCLKKHARVL